MRCLLKCVAAVVVSAVVGLIAAAQPPGGGPPGNGPGGAGPRGFQLGWVLPPHVRNDLELTEEQQKQIAELEKEVKQRLEKILTEKQKRQIQQAGPPGGGPNGPGGQQRGGRGGPGPGRPGGGPPDGGPNGPDMDRGLPDRAARPEAPAVDAPKGMVQNPRFTEAENGGKSPAHFVLKGNVDWSLAGRTNEFTDWGIALQSGRAANSEGKRAGSVSQDVTGFDGGVGKWFRFSFRGLAETGFVVPDNGLFMKVDYFGAKGANSLDGVTRQLYPFVAKDRAELAANGVRHQNGGAVWKTYALEFRLPFNEIDTLRLSVGFNGGSASSTRNSAFYVTEFSLIPIPPPDSAPKIVKKERGFEPSTRDLIHLGGRWYYKPEAGVTERPATLTVTAKNADRLYYLDGRLTNPFAENMTAWLKKGYMDLNGAVVEKDRFIADNVVIEFRDDKTMIVHARNIPNHPTGQFPERLNGRFGNPSYIQEHDYTYYIPLNPVHNPSAIAMDRHNANRALNMGAIGIAINGVVFYNPFDAGMEDATDLMDRCCGHPSPDNRYHYHKYPVCVKSPFIDEGDEHSPLIGFAFDGFPIYGPYEAKALMAKDSKDKPLNTFNIHFDEERGWHYHVTPGKFPYIIGGYYGQVDSRNFPRRGPPR
jgi:hypothetical protein